MRPFLKCFVKKYALAKELNDRNLPHSKKCDDISHYDNPSLKKLQKLSNSVNSIFISSKKTIQTLEGL